MKIAWFSPMVPAPSEIANHTRRLVDQLAAKHEVRFLTEMPDGFVEPATGRHYPAALGQTSQELIFSLNEMDLPVYNLGNHPSFFSRTWFLGQVKPGIVILHDLKLHHFFEGIYRMQLGDMPGYLSSMWQHYGRIGHEAGVAYWKQKISIDFMAQHFPMTAWAIHNALAIVVHTPHALETVGRLTRTPARMIPLAHTPRPSECPVPPSSDFDDEGRFTQARKARVVLFGYLNVNRRIVEFLTALADMPERDRFEVHLMGTVLNRQDVEDAIVALGLHGRVTLYGYVPEAELSAALDRADLAVNLRYPTMGEASASQLRIWDHALPSLVTYSEGYTTLPPETVFFVHPDNEHADVQKHLRHFLARPADFQAAGRQGRQWLLDHHLPAMYVTLLDELFAEADELRSRHNQLALADQVGVTSASWLHTAPATARERFYAASISDLV